MIEAQVSILTIEKYYILIKTILVDDERRLLDSLKMMLEKHCPELDIIACCQHSEEAIIQIKKMKPQLVFMDISMPGKNGFEVLNELKGLDFKIIFVTAHNEFSIRAFKYSAVDYLLKPVDEEELILAVNKVEKSIGEEPKHMDLSALLHNITPGISNQNNKICLGTLTGFQVVLVSDIVYCKAEGNYTNFYLTDKKNILVSRPIIDFDNMLSENDFLRIHKSYMVNLHHIKEYRRGDGGTVIMYSGEEIDVSRRKKDLFLEKAKSIFKI